MALINCPECGNELSEKAVSCPRCGCPLAPEQATAVFCLRRETKAFFCAITYEAFLDYKPWGTIKNGERLEATLPCGLHRLQLYDKTNFNKLVYDNDFTLENENLIFTFSAAINIIMQSSSAPSYNSSQSQGPYYNARTNPPFNSDGANSAYPFVSANETRESLPPKCETAKLVIGIISIVLFFVVGFQSCAVGIGEAILSKGDSGGAFGLLVAFNLLVTGIIAVAARKSAKMTPWIINTALLWLNYFYAKMFRSQYSDLLLWGFLSFAVGVFYLLSAMRTKKQTIIAIIVSAVYLAIALI